MVIQTDKRIKSLRTARGMSQTDLAKVMSITRSCVNAWEMGISVPTTQKLVEMAQIFHVSVDYLLGMESREVMNLDGLTEEERTILHSLLKYFQTQEGKPSAGIP